MRIKVNRLRQLIKEELLSLHEEAADGSTDADAWLNTLNFQYLGHRQDEHGDGLRRHWEKLIKKHGLEAAQELYKKLEADAKSLTKGVFLWPQLQKWLKHLGTKTVTVGFILSMFSGYEDGYDPGWVTKTIRWDEADDGQLGSMSFIR